MGNFSVLNKVISDNDVKRLRKRPLSEAEVEVIMCKAIRKETEFSKKLRKFIKITVDEYYPCPTTFRRESGDGILNNFNN